MSNYVHIVEMLKARLLHDHSGLQENKAEQTKLRDTFFRYQDLENEADRLQKRLERVQCLLSRKESGIPLWLMMGTILEATGRMDIVDLVTCLIYFGQNASRQAIESITKTHPKEFVVLRKGKRKQVDLNLFSGLGTTKNK